MRNLSPEQRQRERSRRRRAERMSQTPEDRSQLPPEDKRDERPTKRPDVPMQDVVAPTPQQGVVSETAPQTKPPKTRRVKSKKEVVGPSGIRNVAQDVQSADVLERIRQENLAFQMSEEEYFQLAGLTGPEFDKPLPRCRSPLPDSGPETASPVAPVKTPGTEPPTHEQQLLEESYEGYPDFPQQASSSLRGDWTAAESFPRDVCATTTTTTTTDVSTENREAEAQQTLGQVVDDEDQNLPSLRCSGGPLIRPLPATWESRVQTAMASPESRQVATTLRGDPLTRRDLATCCTPTAWLNDEIINAYLGHTVNYARQRAGNAGRHDQPKYHAFNSFFYSNLRDKGYESVRRWAGRAKIGGAALLQMDAVFVPIHDHAHWTLMVVKPTARTIEHFDSLGHPSRAHAARVKTWLRGELGDLFKEEDWRVLPSISPQQNNGSDCGVFLLTTAKLAALDLPLKYGAKDIPEIRKRIAAELLNGGFDGDFDPEAEFPIKSML